MSRLWYLVLLCIALAGLVVADNWDLKGKYLGASVTPAISPAPKQAAAPALEAEPRQVAELAAGVNPLAHIERGQLHDMESRPLFVPSRKQYKPPVRKPRPVIARPPPKKQKPTMPYTLRGVMIGGGTRFALLEKRGAPLLTAKQGDRLGPWHVKSVHGDSVTLSAGEETVDLKVFPKRKSR